MGILVFDSLNSMGVIQIVLSIILCIYGVWYFIKYYLARHYRLPGTERADKLLMAVANITLSTVNILLLVLFKA